MLNVEQANFIFQGYGLPIISGTHSYSDFLERFKRSFMMGISSDSEMPPEEDLLVLKSFLQFTAMTHFGDPNLIEVSRWGGTSIFRYDGKGWFYRVCTWTSGPMWIPEKEQEGLTVLDIINQSHFSGKDERWNEWYKKHPQGFKAPLDREQYVATANDMGSCDLFTQAPFPFKVATVHGDTPDEALERGKRFVMLQDQLLGTNQADFDNHDISLRRRFTEKRLTAEQAKWWASALNAMFDGIGIVHTSWVEWKECPEISSGCKIKFEASSYEHSGDGYIHYSVPGWHCAITTEIHVGDHCQVIIMCRTPDRRSDITTTISPIGEGGGFNAERAEIWRWVRNEQYRVGNGKFPSLEKMLVELRAMREKEKAKAKAKKEVA